MQTMTSRTRNICILIVNAFLFISSFVIVILGVASGAGEGQVGESMYGLRYLRAFTNLSNILCSFGAFTVLAFAVDNLFSGEFRFPHWVVLFQYICACAVGLTFITVLLFLAPMMSLVKGQNYFVFFSDDMFFFHFFNPVLAVISFALLLNIYKIEKRDQFLALIPTVIYSVVYFICVVVLKVWSDFYNFTFGGKYFLIPVSVFLMYGFTWVISVIYRRLHNKNIL